MPKRKNSFAAKPAKEARVDDTPIDFSEFLALAAARGDTYIAAQKQPYDEWMQENQVTLIRAAGSLIESTSSDYEERISKLKRLLDKRTTELQEARKVMNKK